MSEWFRSYGFADVGDGLVIGAYPLDARDVGVLSLLHVERVLNLVQDHEYPAGARDVVAEALAGAGIVERRMQTIDHDILPEPLIGAVVEVVDAWLDEGLHVYMHCRAGWERSAAIATAVIAHRHGLEVDAALAQLRASRPSVAPLPKQLLTIRRWVSQRTRAAG